MWSAAKDTPSRSRISSVTYTNSSSVDTGTFYGNDDDSDEADQGDASKDPVTVSDDMAGLVIGDSVAKEYAMVEDHRLVIKCALQLLQVNLLFSSCVVSGDACAKLIFKCDCARRMDLR